MRARVGAVLVIALCVASLTPGIALGHSWGDWFKGRWRSEVINGVNNDRVPQWRFVDNYPMDGSRGVTHNGAQDWNGVSAMAFDLDASKADYSSLQWDTTDCAEFQYQEDKVGWGNFGDAGWHTSEPLAVTKTFGWWSDGAMYNFRIKGNNDVPWYVGTGEVPSNKWDLWGVMTHEFGHATGRTIGGSENDGHFSEGSSYCPSDYTARHTMCPTLDPGRKGQRYLEAHDLDTVQNAYP